MIYAQFFIPLWINISSHFIILTRLFKYLWLRFAQFIFSPFWFHISFFYIFLLQNDKKMLVKKIKKNIRRIGKTFFIVKLSVSFLRFFMSLVSNWLGCITCTILIFYITAFSLWKFYIERTHEMVKEMELRLIKNIFMGAISWRAF
jgi:hypothetical protein